MDEHVAIIMDGNARWAAQRDIDEAGGWDAGVRAARAIVEAAAASGVGNLTLYAAEAGARMPLLTALSDWTEAGLRLRYIGRGDLPAAELARLEEAGRAQAAGMWLNLALDYDGRIEITDAAAGVAREIEAGRLAPADAGEEEISRHLYRPDVPDIDLLIRTGGEDHLAGFMLWQTAYAEIVFAETLWPDFTPDDLAEALAEFGRRIRKFGAIDTI